VSVLQDGITAKLAPEGLVFDGFEDLGVDTYGVKYDAKAGRLVEYTSPELREILADASNLKGGDNERDDTYSTFTRLNLRDAVHAVAAMYAFSKDTFAQHLAEEKVMGAWACRAEELPDHVQFFWTTLYYNTGVETARQTLGHRGLSYHDPVWPHEDDHEKYKLREKYNANWRTASFRLFLAAGGL
jgi:hypothetical protein